jgi:ribulose-5-phosphate 4-epimerase/fuculose-1-phosphate aldolase
VGRDLAEALDVSMLVERVSKIFVYASLLGRVDALPQEVVDAEAEIFRMRLGVETKFGGDM